VVSFEAPGVEPAFATPDAKRKATDYACERFGGSAGEVHVFADDASTIERSIVIEEPELGGDRKDHQRQV
jgi:hypothetical protein